MTPPPDPLLAGYLAGRDVPCPQCGYNLRDQPADRCPECGDALALRLGVAEPRLATLIAGLIGLSAGAGLSGLLMVYVGLAFLLSRRMGIPRDFLLVTSVPFVVEAYAVRAWVRLWPRVRRLPAGGRWAWVAACWALSLANITVFTLWLR